MPKAFTLPSNCCTGCAIVFKTSRINRSPLDAGFLAFSSASNSLGSYFGSSLKWNNCRHCESCKARFRSHTQRLHLRLVHLSASGPALLGRSSPKHSISGRPFALRPSTATHIIHQRSIGGKTETSFEGLASTAAVSSCPLLEYPSRSTLPRYRWCRACITKSICL